MLRTTFTHYERTDVASASVLRAGRYALPAEVAAVTAAVFGLHGFPLPPAPPGSPPGISSAGWTAMARRDVDTPTTTTAGSKVAVTPAVLDTLYNVSAAGVNVTRGSSSHPRRAVVAFSDEYAQILQNKKDPVSSAFPLPSCSHGDASISHVLGEAARHIALIGAPFGSRCN